MLEWWNGRHEGLKILWTEMSVRVRVSLRALPSLKILTTASANAEAVIVFPRAALINPERQRPPWTKMSI